MVLLSITPLLDGVLQLDIIAPFHTSGPLLLLFHLAIEQWGKIAIGSTTVTYPLPYETYSLPVTVGLSPFYGSYYGNYYRPVLPSNPDLDGTALTTETIWEGFYIVVGQ